MTHCWTHYSRFSVWCDYCVLWIAGDSELRNIQPFFFRLWRNAHGLHFVHRPKNHKRSTEGPDCIEGSAHELAPELARVAVEQAGDSLTCLSEIGRPAHAVPSRAVSTIGKNSYADGAQPTAIAMNGNRAAGIIDSEHALVEKDAAADQ